MTALTIFTWGYHGWGSSTLQLKRAMDAVERQRGYAPPYFVDLRMSRGVRAAGFRGEAFEKAVGKDRYRWMRSLGNKRIRNRSGPPIQINEPSAVEELLGLGLARAAKRQRLVIFCSCSLPGRPGQKDSCHRVTVASLLLKLAAKRNVSLTITEWPGGRPRSPSVRVSDTTASKVINGARSVDLGRQQPVADILGLPWGSVIRLRSPSFRCQAIADPPIFQAGKWLLPLPFGATTDGNDSKALKRTTLRERFLSGLNARTSAARQ